MKSKQEKNYYLEREISWMYFNHRVLQEAQDKTVPLLERFYFLGIYSNTITWKIWCRFPIAAEKALNIQIGKPYSYWRL